MWIANLSNGSTATEANSIPGQPSPWQMLLSYCQENGLRVTGLKLSKYGQTIHTLPNKQCDGYFHAYEYRQSAISHEDSTIQGVGSVVGTKVYIIWVDDQGNISPDIRELESCQIHTTLRC